MNLADNLYHMKSYQLFDISANPGAKFFMRNSVTLKKKQRKIVRVLILSQNRRNFEFSVKNLNILYSFALLLNNAPPEYCN